MKSLIRSLACAILVSSTLHAGNILVTNFDETSNRQMPITTISGTPILMGGVVQVGSFLSGDPSALIAGLNSPAGLATLLSDFISFGSSNAIGSDFVGLYASDKSSPLTVGSPLIGKPIYTMIGNNASLAASTELGIVRHPGSFAADAPVFAGLADLSDPATVILYGGRGAGVSTALGLSTQSLRLGVPEPSVALLLVLGLATVAGRRQSGRSRHV